MRRVARAAWRAFTLVAAACSVAACAGGATPLLTEAEDGKSVALEIGEELTVRLEANPSTGYAWEILDAAGTVLVPVGEPAWVPDPPAGAAVGRGGFTTWHFRASRAGEGTLLFVYRRPWEKAAAPARRFGARVTVR